VAGGMADNDLSTTALDGGEQINHRETARELQPRSVRLRLIAADAVAFVVAVVVAFFLQAIFKPVPSFIVAQHVFLVVLSVPVFAVGAGLNKMYLARANQTPREESRNILKATAVGTAGIVTIAFVVQYGALSRFWVWFFFASVLLLVNVVVPLPGASSLVCEQTVGYVVASSSSAQMRTQSD